MDDLGVMAFTNPKDYLGKTTKYGFSASRFGLLGPFHWGRNVGIEKDKRYKAKWESGEIRRSSKGFRNFAKSIPKIPIFVATSYGGCFAVTKEK